VLNKARVTGFPFSGCSWQQSAHLWKLGLAATRHTVGTRAPAVHGAIFTSFALCLVMANLAFDYRVCVCVCVCVCVSFLSPWGQGVGL